MKLPALHAAPQPPPRHLATLIAETHACLDEVAARERELAPWSGTLRRLMTARTVGSSTAIEGFVATEDDTVRILEGQGPVSAPRDTEDAIRDYRRAMDRITGLAADPDFEWRPSVMRELHFLVTASDSASHAGVWREEAVHIRRGGGGIPYEPPPAGEVAGLMQAAAQRQAEGDEDPLVRAAMLHLHVTAVHPFVDGNGRVARVLHALVLARARLLPLDVCSIEQQLADDTRAYYAALRTTNGVHRLGGPEYYDPTRNVEPWLEFCLRAHIQSAQTLLGEMETAHRRARYCLGLAGRAQLPDRIAHVLDQALVSLPITNESHRRRQNVSMPTATKDLGGLVELGWLRRVGGGRSTRYEATAKLRAMWRRAQQRG